MQGPYLRKYGVETKINFVLYEVDGVDFRVDAADGGTDCSIMKDEGAEATCTNDFVDEGNGYSLTLTAGEMEAARIVVYVIDSATKAWLDEAIVVETYGNASAQHAFDLDDGNGTTLTEAGGNGDHLTEAGGDGDHLTEAGGDGDHLTEAGGTGDQLTDLIGADGDTLETLSDQLDGVTGATAAQAGMLLEAEVSTVTSQTVFTLESGSDQDDNYYDQIVVLYDDSNSDFPCVRKCVAYVGATKTMTIDAAADFTLGTDDSIRVFVSSGRDLRRIANNMLISRMES